MNEAQEENQRRRRAGGVATTNTSNRIEISNISPRPRLLTASGECEAAGQRREADELLYKGGVVPGDDLRVAQALRGVQDGGRRAAGHKVGHERGGAGQYGAPHKHAANKNM